MPSRALSASLAVVLVAAVAGLTGAAAAQVRQIRQPRWEVAAIYHNANIYTMDPQRPRAEAMAVSPSGTLLAVGADEAILSFATEPTQRIDLEGRTVLPGLIDAHGHMAALGAFDLGVLDLSDARSFDEVVERVAAAAREKPEGARSEALASMTIDAAYAAFEEQQKGSLAAGKFADFIVIDRDVMTCDVEQIPGTRVLRTVIGGEEVFGERQQSGKAPAQHTKADRSARAS